MKFLWIAAAIVGGMALIGFLTALVCFFKVFYSPKRKPLGEDEYEIPDGRIYEPFREVIVNWIKELRAMPKEQMEIRSFDGLILHGTYYECKKGAPIEILFHGYRGNAERDLCGGVERCFALGRNALIVDQRGSGSSEGRVVTFGIKERRDCLCWIDHVIKRFGADTKIIITGISMGAATVMMAAGEDLPKNVVCVLADCGYSSPKEIIQKVMRDMHLPVGVVYPFVKLGARLFGGFDLEETSPMEAVKKSKVPIIFIHGDTDDFVPYGMSRALYEACASQKKLVPIAGAGHGLAFPMDKQTYLQSLVEFQEECGF